MNLKKVGLWAGLFLAIVGVALELGNYQNGTLSTALLVIAGVTLLALAIWTGTLAACNPGTPLDRAVAPGRDREAVDQLTASDLVLVQELGPDDCALANACFEIEAGLRAEAFDAVEKLASTIGTAGGSVEDRVCALPDPEFRRAARLALVRADRP